MNTRLCKEEFTRIPMWVKIHDVPLQVVYEDGISIIAFHIDTLTMGVPLIEDSGFLIEIVRIEYEWKPTRCDLRKIFGHVHDQCPKKVTITPPTEEKANDGFQTVSKRRRRVNQGPLLVHVAMNMTRHRLDAATVRKTCNIDPYGSGWIMERIPILNHLITLIKSIFSFSSNNSSIPQPEVQQHMMESVTNRFERTITELVELVRDINIAFLWPGDVKLSLNLHGGVDIMTRYRLDICRSADAWVPSEKSLMQRSSHKPL
ncbi:hypothetical protein Tco_0371500 [Tanacetum coccineum]